MADARANRFGLWRGLNKRCRVTDIFQASCSERCRIRPLCYGRNKPILVIEKTVLRIWVESSPNPRSEMPQFEQAGFLTYSRIKNLPDLVMDLRQWYESSFWYAFWKLQQRDCPGFPPDSLFIRNAGRQTGHDFLNTDPKWMLPCIEREASIFSIKIFIMCNRISVPLQSSPCKIHVIFQSGPYKSFAGPDLKQMELPAQICQTPRDRHAASNAEGGQKSLLPKVLCCPQIAGAHRIHAVV